MAAAAKTKAKPACKYGGKCYRRNPQHIRDYSHPSEETVDDDSASAVKQSSEESSEKKPEKQKRTIQDFFSPSHKNVKENTKSEETPPTKRTKTDSQTSSQEREDIEERELGESFTEEDTENTPEQDEDLSTEVPDYPDDVRECIKKTFLLEMPEDFYQFWDFCKNCNKLDPSSLLRKSVGLCLTGPFDILSGRHKQVMKNKRGRHPNFLLHQRFYYDPPEFQTILTSDEDSEFHIGYFRDDPNEMPVFLASNSPGRTSTAKEKLVQCGDNIFAAVHIYATQKLKSEKGEKKRAIERLIQSIEKEAKRAGLLLSPVTKSLKERQKKVNCSTFHGAGMVVPVDANDVGYRPVPETQKDLKAMLKKIVEGETETKREQASEALQEIITFIQFANDECDYGEGLELGLCLFSYGSKELHPQISFLMPLAYELLNRPQFKHIIEAHLKCRRDVGESVDELEV